MHRTVRLRSRTLACNTPGHRRLLADNPRYIKRENETTVDTPALWRVNPAPICPFARPSEVFDVSGSGNTNLRYAGIPLNTTTSPKAVAIYVICANVTP